MPCKKNRGWGGQPSRQGRWLGKHRFPENKQQMQHFLLLYYLTGCLLKQQPFFTEAMTLMEFLSLGTMG